MREALEGTAALKGLATGAPAERRAPVLEVMAIVQVTGTTHAKYARTKVAGYVLQERA